MSLTKEILSSSFKVIHSGGGGGGCNSAGIASRGGVGGGVGSESDMSVGANSDLGTRLLRTFEIVSAIVGWMFSVCAVPATQTLHLHNCLVKCKQARKQAFDVLQHSVSDSRSYK